MTRNRQVKFDSPFEIIDPERTLWTPRRDRIFVPSNYPTSRSLTDAWEAAFTALDLRNARRIEDFIERYNLSDDFIHRICTPGRQELIAPYRIVDIERSVRPMWRAEFGRYNRQFGR